jgi:hypothetical protein
VTDLDWGTLAKIDRKVLSRLGHDETWQMVRVPVSDATWSAWKRYCDALGISMGRGLAALMQHELRSVLGDGDGGRPVFLDELEAELARRQRTLDTRERNLVIKEQRLRAMTEMQEAPSAPPWLSAAAPKVGRNDPCPCGSVLKYKRCHGG